MSLAEVENIAVLQSFTLEGSGGHAPVANLIISGVLHEAHSGAFWCILRHTEKHTELLEKRLIKIVIACRATGTLENHLHQLRSIYTTGLLPILHIGVGSKFEV